MKLIDKDKALTAIVDGIRELHNEDSIVVGEKIEEIGLIKAFDIIKRLPTVEPRPKGKWIYTRGDYFSVRCGVCGFKNQCEDNFCPKCGADMRKETNKGETHD